MKPVPAAIVNYFAKYASCGRCYGGGVYADPKMHVNGRRVAISQQAVALGNGTEACPICGANCKPK